MGCVNTKTVPEEQVGVVQQTHVSGRATSTEAAITNADTHHKNAKWRAKFDQRVTRKYDIKALVGRGTFSRVVRVEHRITKQPYAIKMIERVNSGGGKDSMDVSVSELVVLRRVKHANIIRLIEVFESKEKIYMVMELATGGELFDRIITKGNFTERDATHVLSMVLDGVGYLHELGITHRDLKPENLLYYHPGQDSKILITDFGLSSCARATEECTMRTTCGTAEYIAPEILARKMYSCKVDSWAVGVVSYILLSGTMPFDEENKNRLYRKILKAEYHYAGEHWKEISTLAKNFIDQLLCLDVSKRLSAKQALQHPWLVTSAASSSNKNLHRTISKNLMERQSTRSLKSAKSTKSARSTKSLRSEHRRVNAEELDALHRQLEHNHDQHNNENSASAIKRKRPKTGRKPLRENVVTQDHNKSNESILQQVLSYDENNLSIDVLDEKASTHHTTVPPPEHADDTLMDRVLKSRLNHQSSQPEFLENAGPVERSSSLLSAQSSTSCANSNYSECDPIVADQVIEDCVSLAQEDDENLVKTRKNIAIPIGDNNGGSMFHPIPQ